MNIVISVIAYLAVVKLIGDSIIGKEAKKKL